MMNIMNLKNNDKVKLVPADKLTIEGETRTVLQWVKQHPITLKRFLHTNRETHKLSAHLELELKSNLNEQNKRSNSKRSS